MNNDIIQHLLDTLVNNEMLSQAANDYSRRECLRLKFTESSFSDCDSTDYDEDVEALYYTFHNEFTTKHILAAVVSLSTLHE